MTAQPVLFIDNAPFLGRIDEQQRFRDALRQVLQENSVKAKVKGLVGEQDAPPLPFVFLLYGEGGMGKSTLAKQLRHITTTEVEFKGHFETLWLDWETRRQIDLKLVTRESVSPETVFEHLYAIFRDANFGKEFDAYEKACTTRAESEKKVAQALEATVGEGSDRYAGLRELGAQGLAWLVRSGLAGGTPLPIPQEPIAKAFGAILGGGAEAIASARETANTLLRARLNPDEFDLFTLPNETLARKLADGIWKAAQKKPILLTLDTYEIADRADVWLRVVIKRAGPNVIWIIAGRDNLAESRKYGSGYQPGYRADFASDRLRVFSMDEFSISDVAEYFKYRVPERPLDETTAKAIHQAALGIPLAVKEATAIWQNPAKVLNDITGDDAPSRDRDKIVQTMTERFLMHCWSDPKDRLRLYALALAYQPDADLLRSMLDTQDLEAELSDLERRHSFVFVTDMKLHDKVSAWIREYLQAEVRRKSKDIRDLNQRAIDHLRGSLTKIETELILIEDCCANDDWVIAAIGLAYHLFWIDETEAWRWFLSRFIEGQAYNQNLRSSLLQIAHDASNVLNRVNLKRIKHLGEGEESILGELFQAEAQGWLKEAEHRTIFSLWHGQHLYRNKHFTAALQQYARAQSYLPKECRRLKKSLGEALYVLAQRLRRIGQIEQSLIAYRLATEVDPQFTAAYYALGSAHHALRNYKESIEAFHCVISLTPNYADVYNYLGSAYRAAGLFNEAISVYVDSIKANPQSVASYNSLGKLYRSLDRFEDAITVYQHALTISPKFLNAYYGLAITYRAQGKYNESISAFQEALKIDPQHGTLRRDLSKIYQLLGHYEEGLKELREAVKLHPKDGSIYTALAGLLKRLGYQKEYLENVRLAKKLITGQREYSRACLESICGDANEALALLKVALEKKQATKAWARRDPDLESLRSDPRFIALVGETDDKPSADSSIG